MSVAEAFVTVRPDTQRFGRDLRSSLGGLAKVGAAAGLAIGAAVVGAAVDGLRQWGQFERQMNEVFTLLPGISEEAMGKMQRDVRDFSVEMGVATEEAVPALYQALSAGVDEDNVFEFMEVAAQAAIGGITDLETAVDGITSVVNAYGEDVISASEASDILFTTVRLGKTDFEQLSSSVFQVAPIASAANVAFEEVGAAIATLTGMGTPTSVAMTQMRSAISELTQEGTKASDAFKEMAGESFPDFMAAGGDLEDALGFMADAAEDSGLSVLDLFGSVEAGQAILGLTGQGAEAFGEALEEMADSAGATEAAFNQMDQGSARAWERLWIAVHDLRISIGEQLAPTVERFVDWLVDKIPEITEFFDRIGNKFTDLLEASDESTQGIIANLGGFSMTSEDVSGQVAGHLSQMGIDVGDYRDTVGESLTGAGEVLSGYDIQVAQTQRSTSDEFDTMGGFMSRLWNAWKTIWDEDIKPWLLNTAVPWIENVLAPALGRALYNVGSTAASSLWDGLKSQVTPGNIGRALTGPLRRGISAFDNVFHDGGVVPGRPGEEVPALLMAGETVLPTHDAQKMDRFTVPMSRGSDGITINGNIHVGSRHDLQDLRFEVRKLAVANY